MLRSLYRCFHLLPATGADDDNKAKQQDASGPAAEALDASAGQSDNMFDTGRRHVQPCQPAAETGAPAPQPASQVNDTTTDRGLGVRTPEGAAFASICGRAGGAATSPLTGGAMEATGARVPSHPRLPSYGTEELAEARLLAERCSIPETVIATGSLQRPHCSAIVSRSSNNSCAGVHNSALLAFCGCQLSHSPCIDGIRAVKGVHRTSI